MTPRPFAARAYQSLALAFLSRVPRGALWAAPGMGKTATVLAYLDVLHNVLG